MSHYFRCAAQCDPTTAVISPVPLYNEVEEAPTPSAASILNSSPGAAAHATTELDRTRAAVEKPVVHDIRREIKRQANVLSKLADREEKMRLRGIQEKLLTERVLAQLGRREDDVEGIAEDVIERSAAAEGKRGMQPADATSSNVEVEPPEAAAFSTTKTSRADTAAISSIPLFELIKMEEERQLRKSALLGKPTSGSIAALYNTLTYESLRLEHPELPPSELVRMHQDTFIPASVEELVSQPRSTMPQQRTADNDSGEAVYYGHEAQRRALGASLSRSAELQANHHAILQQEAARQKVVEQARRKRDLESRTVLREVIEHDQAHRQFQEEQRLFRLAQYHEHSLLGSFSADAVADGLSSDPLLPPMPENVREALQLSKRPVHPIDAYQSEVRREILRRE